MKKIIPVFLSILFISITANANTYLGQYSNNNYGSDSTSNPYGQYGSQYSSTSINNPNSQYGSAYSSQGVNNPYATNTPKIYAQDGTRSAVIHTTQIQQVIRMAGMEVNILQPV